jgi:hypothetical protein
MRRERGGGKRREEDYIWELGVLRWGREDGRWKVV